MVDDVRKYVEAALEKLTPERAQRLARSMLKGAAPDQVGRSAQELVQWSQRSAERMRSSVEGEVRRQLRSLGLATRDEVEALRKRVRVLEKGTSKDGAPTKRRTPAQRRTPAKTAAKRTAR